ncbi:hypothetical protein UFOVP164_21 [uncultured Caudovirales phage]|uniref:Uncharacterized protein n=1 Tax=uncultured Caudovirales phage TaxID=2100421 RepID=A0A6J7XLY5_9CAUD|nr:hypothetical protein UFOVP164_21 [uncultured Caudovirales phage]
MTKEALKMALEALEFMSHVDSIFANEFDFQINAIKEALTQPDKNEFNPDYNTEAVLVEEMQRMAKRIEDLEAMLERQTAHIVGLQDEIRNLTGEE